MKYEKSQRQHDPEDDDDADVDAVDETVLGRGKFGIVRKAVLTMNDGEKVRVAAKTPLEDDNISEWRSLRREAGTLCHIGDHENIVRFVGLIDDAGNAPILLTELHENAENLRSIFKKEQPLDELTKFRLLHDLCTAVGFGHSRNNLHRDISAANLLVQKQSGSYGRAILIDFGHARHTNERRQYSGTKAESFLREYAAIECLDDKRRLWSVASEVWAVGVVAWNMFNEDHREPPYANEIESETLPDDMRIDFLEKGHRLKFPKPSPSEIAKRIEAIVETCWKYELDHRPTVDTLTGMIRSILEAEPRK